mmetsp:Transcript_38094/g.91891  ORF Transcript_38094/g.91891 Transcript_38094/m.91891 type:complete len:351 (-) Transcript_38094:2328-3380(-)
MIEGFVIVLGMVLVIDIIRRRVGRRRTHAAPHRRAVDIFEDDVILQGRVYGGRIPHVASIFVRDDARLDRLDGRIGRGPFGRIRMGSDERHERAPRHVRHEAVPIVCGPRRPVVGELGVVREVVHQHGLERTFDLDLHRLEGVALQQCSVPDDGLLTPLKRIQDGIVHDRAARVVVAAVEMLAKLLRELVEEIPVHVVSDVLVLLRIGLRPSHRRRQCGVPVDGNILRGCGLGRRGRRIVRRLRAKRHGPVHVVQYIHVHVDGRDREARGRAVLEHGGRRERAPARDGVRGDPRVVGGGRVLLVERDRLGVGRGDADVPERDDLRVSRGHGIASIFVNVKRRVVGIHDDE